MFIIGRRATKLIVRNWTTTRKVLQEATPAVVAKDDVKLPIRTESQNTAIVITTRWLARILLQGSQFDEIAIESQRQAIPHITIDTVAEHRNFVDVCCIDARAAFGPEKI
jgi:hypothetical protein